MPITLIQVPGSRPPGGHYSQAVVHQGLVYVSGQLPIDLVSGARSAGPIEEQAAMVFANLDTILRAAGSDIVKLLKVTIYLSDVQHWEAVNAIYSELLGSHRPARAVVPTGPLHHGFLIEVEAIAAQDG